MVFLKKYKNHFIVLLSLILYFFLAYGTKRTAFFELTTLWILLFVCFYFLMHNRNVSIQYLFGAAILSRLVFFFSIPFLSQDFYRFIWDGRMLLEGYNPYLYLPDDFIQQGLNPIAQSKQLHEGMGALSARNYTNYPPVNQLCFLIGSFFSNQSILGNIIVLRSLIILADIGSLLLGLSLLKKLKINPKNIFWFVLNPFIIIEMTGNLHFESVMLFFFLLSLYYLQKKKWVWSAVWLAFSISVKLIPILFLPLFMNWFIKNKFQKPYSNWFRLALFYTIVAGVFVVSFIPFLSEELLLNYTKSVGLWFRKFEFNASFYYLFREIGYLFRGYNEIAIIGKISAILTVIFTMIFTFFKQNKSISLLSTSMLMVISFYFLVATTVHPWYIATPLLLSVFTKYRFPVFWSFVVILSYQAYANNPWKEKLWIVFLEYFLLFGFIIFEYYIRKRKQDDLIIS